MFLRPFHTRPSMSGAPLLDSAGDQRAVWWRCGRAPAMPIPGFPRVLAACCPPDDMALVELLRVLSFIRHPGPIPPITRPGVRQGERGVQPCSSVLSNPQTILSGSGCGSTYGEAQQRSMPMTSIPCPLCLQGYQLPLAYRLAQGPHRHLHLRQTMKGTPTHGFP